MRIEEDSAGLESTFQEKNVFGGFLEEVAFSTAQTWSKNQGGCGGARTS